LFVSYLTPSVLYKKEKVPRPENSFFWALLDYIKIIPQNQLFLPNDTMIVFIFFFMIEQRISKEKIAGSIAIFFYRS